MMRALLLCGAALAAVLASSTALAADDETKPSDCAFVRTIDRFAVVDERTIIIEVSPSRRFKVTFTTTCDLKYARFARLDPRPVKPICLSPGNVIVFTRTPFGNDEPEDECMIRKVEAIPAPADGEPAPN
jgi:hypothetical protein